MDVAHRPQVQHDGSRSFVIRCIQDQQAVVVPQGPVDFLDLRTEFLGLGLEDRCTLRRVVDVFDALLSEFDRRDEGYRKPAFLSRSTKALDLVLSCSRTARFLPSIDSYRSSASFDNRRSDCKINELAASKIEAMN